jgi:hypothetical protein
MERVRNRRPRRKWHGVESNEDQTPAKLTVDQQVLASNLWEPKESVSCCEPDIYKHYLGIPTSLQNLFLHLSLNGAKFKNHHYQPDSAIPTH